MNVIDKNSIHGFGHKQKNEGKRPFGTSRGMWDNIKMDLTETG